MLIFGDIKILEHWSQMNSLNFYALLIFLENTFDDCNFLWSHVEILSSGMNCVINSYGSNLLCWVLLNAIAGEGRIDAGAEGNVVEFAIRSLVFAIEGIVFCLSQVEVEH